MEAQAFRWSNSTVFTEHSQRTQGSGACVDVMGRKSQDVSTPGRMAIASVTAGTNEARIHAIW